MRALGTLLLLLLAGCASPPPVARLTGHPWTPVGYPGFAESIDALVGRDAIDCGFLEISGEPENLAERRHMYAARGAAYACVQDALGKKVPFKFGAVHIPIDSYAHEVLARGTDGRLWLIVYDIMVDGTAPQQWNKVCDSASIDKATLYLHGTGCVAASDGRLKQT